MEYIFNQQSGVPLLFLNRVGSLTLKREMACGLIQGCV